MRTSNKILLGYIILIFLLPVLVLMSFNTKIKNGRYTVEKQQGQGSNFRSGSFKPYKVVKFIAPAGRVLQANLQHSDSLFYSYHQMGGLDSIKVYNTGDTLFVQFINPDKNYVEHLSVNLKLPSFDNLVIENAEVTLDSTSGSVNSDLLVEILGTGLLNIGKKKEHRVGPDAAAVTEFPYTINRLSVKMNEGEIALGGKANIKQLDMQVNGAGVVSINEGAAIGEVSGHLSEKSSVKANWKYVKKLAALATE